MSRLAGIMHTEEALATNISPDEDRPPVLALDVAIQGRCHGGLRRLARAVEEPPLQRQPASQDGHKSGGGLCASMAASRYATLQPPPTHLQISPVGISRRSLRSTSTAADLKIPPAGRGRTPAPSAAPCLGCTAASSSGTCRETARESRETGLSRAGAAAGGLPTARGSYIHGLRRCRFVLGDSFLCLLPAQPRHPPGPPGPAPTTAAWPLWLEARLPAILRGTSQREVSTASPANNTRAMPGGRADHDSSVGPFATTCSSLPPPPLQFPSNSAAELSAPRVTVGSGLHGTPFGPPSENSLPGVAELNQEQMRLN